MNINYIRMERGLIEVKSENDPDWYILKHQDTRQYVGALEFVLEVFAAENNKAEPDVNVIIEKIKAELKRVTI